MAVYDPILSAETDPDQPLKSSLAKRWSENWIAGFEGAVGAPRLLLRGLEELVAGSSLRLTRTVAGTASSSFVELLTSRFNLAQRGTVRISFGYNKSGAIGTTVDTRIVRLRAGSATSIAAFSTASSSPVSTSTDVDCLPGDEFYLEGRSNGGSTLANISSYQVSVDPTSFLWPASLTSGFVQGNPF